MSKQQAEHNENACNLLLHDGNFNDWVVTTAFYSALHYVEFQLFPLKIGKVTYNSFNEYFDQACQSLNISKHRVKCSLVDSNLPCGSEYRWLMDECMNARYVDYNVDKETAKMANNCLKRIKKHVTK